MIETLQNVESMPATNLEEIVEKYVEMNIAHPFLEGNGRATRIWLDLILNRNIGQVVDWSLIDKNDCLEAMKKSPWQIEPILSLINSALTKDIDNRDIYIRGIDYSYYYEEL